MTTPPVQFHMVSTRSRADRHLWRKAIVPRYVGRLCMTLCAIQLVESGIAVIAVVMYSVKVLGRICLRRTRRATVMEVYFHYLLSTLLEHVSRLWSNVLLLSMLHVDHPLMSSTMHATIRIHLWLSQQVDASLLVLLDSGCC